MTDKDYLALYCKPLDKRSEAQSLFVRIIGLDSGGQTLHFLKDYYGKAACNGIYLQYGIPNPTEPEIARFFETVGDGFIPASALVSRHITVWLGQLRPAQRDALSRSLWDTLELLRKKNVNENIIKNTYIKFMCWLRGPFGHILTGLGKITPPKILFEGDISKYELLMLHLLHCAGCDVVYVHFTSSERYDKIDTSGVFSILVQGDQFVPPAHHFTAQDPPLSRPAPQRASQPSPSVAPKPSPSAQPRRSVAPSPAPIGEAPWKGMEDTVLLNDWVGERPMWEAILLPNAQRFTAGQKKICALFATCFGADERGVYRNRLFSLKRALDGTGKRWLLMEQGIPAPSAAETEPFRGVQKSAPRDQVICELAIRLTPDCGQVQSLLTQQAFAEAMAANPEPDPVRFFNHCVRLACWLRRYTEQLFDGYRVEQQPSVVFYGAIREAEAMLLWALAHTGIDVLYFSSDAREKSPFSSSFMPHTWIEILFEGTLPAEPFPQREERMRAATTAYDASRQLDQLLYRDSGMFRDRQFTRSQPVTLKTTYDEVGQLWPEDAQFRPSFAAQDGVVYVPNLFSKICGVDKGDKALYWDKIHAMITENTFFVASVPFWKPPQQGLSVGQARNLLPSGKLDVTAVKTSHLYRYGYLPDDTQNYILEKIQSLIDYDLIVNGGSDMAAVMLTVLLHLEKDLLQLIQNFDFPREIPKFLIVDVTETMFSLEECILLAFLNLVGFDIAVFTPTGYRNLETHLRPDSFDTLNAGEFLFDMAVPDLRGRRSSRMGGDWLSRLFGGRG